MTKSSLLDSEFNAFLFAPIGKERNEMLLSVLSALARLGVDPWQEAARLAQLPKELAAQRLAAMIRDLPDGRWASSDSNMIAARLVQLLPARMNSGVSSVAVNGSVPQMIRYLALMSLIYAVMWGAVFMAGNGEPPPSGVNHPVAPLTNAVAPPQAPLPNSD